MKVPLPLLLVVGIVGCGYGSSPPNGEAVDDAQSKAENGVAEFALPKTKNGVAKAHQPNADKPLAPAADANPVVAPKDRRGQQRIAVIDLERVIREDTDPFLTGFVRRTKVRSKELRRMGQYGGAPAAINSPRVLTADQKEVIVQCKERILQMETELDGLFQRSGYSPADQPRPVPHIRGGGDGSWVQRLQNHQRYDDPDYYSIGRYSRWRLMRMQDAVAVVAKQHGYNVILNVRPLGLPPLTSRPFTGPHSPPVSGLTIYSDGGGGESKMRTAIHGFEGDAYSGLVVFHDKQDDITDLVIELLKRE
jgi:hypothetical protein